MRTIIQGQLNLDTYIANLRSFTVKTCSDCICSSCLLKQSGRCPHGSCYDDLRAVINPYDKAHPDKPPRTGWSNWKTDQAFWCRGGIFYPAKSCVNYIKYTGCRVEECINAPVVIFQDGYISCSLVECIGCKTCYERFVKKMLEDDV